MKVMNIFIIFFILFYSSFVFGNNNYDIYDDFTYARIDPDNYNIGDMLSIINGYYRNTEILKILDINGDNIPDYLSAGETDRDGRAHLLHISECGNIFREYYIGTSGPLSINIDDGFTEVCIPPNISDYELSDKAVCLCYKYLDGELKSRYLMIDKNIFENELEFACPTGE